MNDKRKQRIDRRIKDMRRKLCRLERKTVQEDFTYSTEQPIIEVGIQALRDELRRLGEERSRMARESNYWVA